MAKIDIEKVTTTGTAKKRLLLLAEDRVRESYGLEKILTDEETKTLVGIIVNKPSELKLSEKWEAINRKLRTAIMNLQTFQFELLMNYSNLRGFILVWDAISEGERIGNSILREIKDLEERKRIGSLVRDRAKLLFTDIELDKQGFLKMKRDPLVDPRPDKYRLQFIIEHSKQNVLDSAGRFLSLRLAILDGMKKEGFVIKTYKNHIIEMTEEIYKPIIGSWAHPESTLWEEPEKLGTGRWVVYSFLPDIKKIEVDPVIYRQYKKQFFGYE